MRLVSVDRFPNGVDPYTRNFKYAFGFAVEVPETIGVYEVQHVYQKYQEDGERTKDRTFFEFYPCGDEVPSWIEESGDDGKKKRQSFKNLQCINMDNYLPH